VPSVHAEAEMNKKRAQRLSLASLALLTCMIHVWYSCESCQNARSSTASAPAFGLLSSMRLHDTKVAAARQKENVLWRASKDWSPHKCLTYGKHAERLQWSR
jgi:hypothetical protein